MLLINVVVVAIFVAIMHIIIVIIVISLNEGSICDLSKLSPSQRCIMSVYTTDESSNSCSRIGNQCTSTHVINARSNPKSGACALKPRPEQPV